jgi:hypothetical protein
VLVAQADWNKNKWKGAVFVLAVTGLGCYIPYKCARAAAARCAAAADVRARRLTLAHRRAAPAFQGDGLCAEEGGRRVVDYVRQISVYSTQPKAAC